MVFVDLKTNKELTKKSTINQIFAIPLFLKNFISYNIIRNFDHNLDHQFILSKKIIQTFNNLQIFWFFSNKIYISLIKKNV